MHKCVKTNNPVCIFSDMKWWGRQVVKAARLKIESVWFLGSNPSPTITYSFMK